MSLKRSPLKTRKPLKAVGRKKPTCPVCEKEFVRQRPMQVTCGEIACAIEDGKRKQVAKRVAPYRAKPKRNTKAVREFNENDPKHVERQARAYLHRWIKYRDYKEAADNDVELVCMACQKPMSHLSPRAIHASHFRPSGMNSAVRYHEDNIWLCDSACNSEKSGNLTEYEIHLIEKIGKERVEWLKTQNQVKKWTIDELREIRDEYAKRLRKAGVKLPSISR